MTSGEGYCGVVAVSAAAGHHGASAELAAYANPRFVSVQGSRTGQLVDLAGEIGTPALPAGAMSPLEIWLTGLPAVCHVRTGAFSPEANHWVVLSPDGLGFRSYDSNCGVWQAGSGDLTRRWDGETILVAGSALQMWAAGAVVLGVRVLTLAGLAVGLVGLFGWVRARLPQTAWGSPVAAAATVLPLALLLAGVQTPGAERKLAQIGEITSDELQTVAESGGALLIDARSPGSFAAGTIAGAVSVPIGLTESQWQKTLGPLTELGAREAVVFCQSSRCPYSDYVAPRVAAELNIPTRIYRGGLLEWTEHQNRTPASGSRLVSSH